MTATHFAAAATGQWRITSITATAGATLPGAACLSIDGAPRDAAWTLRGTPSNLRYTTAQERTGLVARQEGIGRPQATRAALIPIAKSDTWWALAQDERRAIYMAGGHYAIGLDYLPAIARKLYHCRDLGGEPFDFLTWFEFAPEHEAAFDAMLVRLRAGAEWDYVTREVDIRLTRVA